MLHKPFQSLEKGGKLPDHFTKLKTLTSTDSTGRGQKTRDQSPVNVSDAHLKQLFLFYLIILVYVGLSQYFRLRTFFCDGSRDRLAEEVTPVC